MATNQGGKGGARRRQATKNYRRAIRKGAVRPDNRQWRQSIGKVPKWMRGEPMMKFGTGGTDKGHRGGRKIGRGNVRYSDKPADS